jgi:UDP-N-acetylglucosamine 4,6-dehydratase/5-epimerase
MQSILITGGTGTFGRAFVKRMLERTDINRIAILSRNEHAQADMAERFDNDSRLRFFIGDVRDRDRLRWAFDSVDTVVHAAALKRIEVGYYNPNEMVKTNVLGTMNVIEAAMDVGVSKVVGISSDKAWQPVSAYGQTKAIGETLLLNANNTGGDDGPAFSVVRYGNVAGSNGSVIPKWARILQSNDTVPVSDPDCTRFWMLIEEAVDMVHDVICNKVEKYLTVENGIHVPRLPAFRIGDLAAVMGAKINVTGLPAWEKQHEGMADGVTSDIAPRMTEDELAAQVRRLLNGDVNVQSL